MGLSHWRKMGWILNWILFSFVVGISFPSATMAYQVVCIGDSLTEGYSIKASDAYPALLEKKLQLIKPESKVINAGISGATTQIAASQMEKWLPHKPDFIVLALGSNDGLRGLPIAGIKQNLSKALELAKKNKTPVLLTGLKMPPNYGPIYQKQFDDLFFQLAKAHSLTFMPFLLEGVAGQTELNLVDQIHPNEKGHKKIAEQMWPYWKKILKIK